jgi:ATP adenylyltransferase
MAKAKKLSKRGKVAKKKAQKTRAVVKGKSKAKKVAKKLAKKASRRSAKKSTKKAVSSKKRGKGAPKSSLKTAKLAWEDYQWPIDREVLFRPERFAYISDKSEKKSCVFCDSIRRGVSSESLVLWQSSTATILMNKYPYNNGHILVIPNAHKGDLLDLSTIEYMGVNEAVRIAVKALKHTYQCQGMNLGMNLGRSAGAGIPDHLHYHVIPRWVGDSNFFPVIGRSKAISETLQQSYDRLINYFVENMR